MDISICKSNDLRVDFRKQQGLSSTAAVPAKEFNDYLKSLEKRIGDLKVFSDFNGVVDLNSTYTFNKSEAYFTRKVQIVQSDDAFCIDKMLAITMLALSIIFIIGIILVPMAVVRSNQIQEAATLVNQIKATKWLMAQEIHVTDDSDSVSTDFSSSIEGLYVFDQAHADPARPATSFIIDVTEVRKTKDPHDDSTVILEEYIFNPAYLNTRDGMNEAIKKLSARTTLGVVIGYSHITTPSGELYHANVEKSAPKQFFMAVPVQTVDRDNVTTIEGILVIRPKIDHLITYRETLESGDIKETRVKVGDDFTPDDKATSTEEIIEMDQFEVVFVSNITQTKTHKTITYRESKLGTLDETEMETIFTQVMKQIKGEEVDQPKYIILKNDEAFIREVSTPKPPASRRIDPASITRMRAAMAAHRAAAKATSGTSASVTAAATTTTAPVTTTPPTTASA